jgi:hypothetical protein
MEIGLRDFKVIEVLKETLIEFNLFFILISWNYDVLTDSTFLYYIFIYINLILAQNY